jgi:hypothetical protein
MHHHDAVQHVKAGTDYKAPLRAINETIEGLVHCGLIVRDHEVQLTPETRALDAIGVQVERELRQRAEMIRALVERCNVLEEYVRSARLKGFITDDENRQAVEDAVMPEQTRARGRLHLTPAIPMGGQTV